MIFLVEHPSTITLGRSTESADMILDSESLTAKGIEVLDVDRGGRATYHGPGQWAAYPVIDLSRRTKDLRAYIALLEDAGAAAVNSFGVPARPGRDPIGVFVGDLKIASVGVSVRRWTTMHGIALNVSNSMDVYDYFLPCGQSGSKMARLSDFAAATMESVANALGKELLSRLSP